MRRTYFGILLFALLLMILSSCADVGIKRIIENAPETSCSTHEFEMIVENCANAIPCESTPAVVIDETVCVTASEKAESAPKKIAWYNEIDYMALLRCYMDSDQTIAYLYSDADADGVKELFLNCKTPTSAIDAASIIAFDMRNSEAVACSFGKDINESARGGVTIAVNEAGVPVLVEDAPCVDGSERIYYEWQGDSAWKSFAKQCVVFDADGNESCSYVYRNKEVGKEEFLKKTENCANLKLPKDNWSSVSLPFEDATITIEQYTSHLQNVFDMGVLFSAGDFDVDSSDEYAWLIPDFTSGWKDIGERDKGYGEVFYPRRTALILANKYEGELLFSVQTFQNNQFVDFVCRKGGIDLENENGIKTVMTFLGIDKDGFPAFSITQKTPPIATDAPKNGAVPAVKYIGKSVKEIQDMFGETFLSAWESGGAGYCIY